MYQQITKLFDKFLQTTFYDYIEKWSFLNSFLQYCNAFNIIYRALTLCYFGFYLAYIEKEIAEFVA